MFGAIVDWGALGQVVALSFAAALALTVLFTSGVLAFARDGAGSGRRAVGGTALALCAGLVVLGLYVMFTSK
jgi:hypothetical protein